MYKAKIQYDGSLDKLNLRIVVRGDLKNKYMIGDTCSLTSSTRTLKYFLADAYKHKVSVHQFYLIGECLRANVKHRGLVKLDSRYGEYFPEYCNYFGRPLRLKKSIYGMTNSRKLISDELTN